MTTITVRLSHRALDSYDGARSCASDHMRAEVRLAVEGAVEDAYPDASLDVGWAGELSDDGYHAAHVRLSGGGACDALHVRDAVEVIVRRAAQDAIACHMEPMP